MYMGHSNKLIMQWAMSAWCMFWAGFSVKVMGDSLLMDYSWAAKAQYISVKEMATKLKKKHQNVRHS